MKNFIDKMIEPFAPAMVAKRLQARYLIQAYEAAKVTRTHKAKGQPLSADASLQMGAMSLRYQSRKLDEDHDLVTGLFDRLEERVVGGAGISVEPIPLTLAGDIHLDFAAQIKDEWAEWSLHPEVSGELTRPQMERQVCRTWLRDGEMLAQKIRGNVPFYTHLTDVPFALELLEPDYLPFNLNDDAIGLAQGIERDAWRRVRAFHLLKTHPGNVNMFAFQYQTKRVLAEQIIHIAHRKRIGQNRGLPLLHAVLVRLADMKDYEESERVAARISAALAMFIRKGTPDLYTGPANGEATAERTIALAPGTVVDNLLPGEDVGMIQSNRPNPFLEPFRNGQLRAIAAGTRSAYSTVARTYDGTYSAQRQELVEAQLGYDLLQHEFIDYWSRPVYREFMAMGLVSGRLKPPRDVDPRTLYGAIYQGPVMPWINPKQEADAWEILVKAGFADEAEVARARGRNPQELKRTRTAEVETNRAADLVFSSDAYHQFYAKQGAASEQPPE
ncbi:MAG: phage portal protein [Phyllobacterium sp.]|uniref:phage portal protein n=1 Tax=Phyllobacterium sp. TaxID=1871046 RepID=UPI0030F0FEBF